VPPKLRKTPRNPYLTKALGAVSLERAKELAWQWWTSSESQIGKERSQEGHRFEEVSRSYLEELKTKQKMIDTKRPLLFSVKKYARHEQSLRLHLNPFFGSMGIKNIGPEEVELWAEWRLLPHALEETGQDGAKNTTEPKGYSSPARSTVQKDAVAFAAVLRHARLQFKVDTRFVPELPLPARTEDTRRPRFYPDEWQRMSKALYERMNSRIGKRGPLSQNSIWFRCMLFFFVMTLHGTGLRVAEAMRLKVKHLRRVPEHSDRLEAYRKDNQLQGFDNESIEAQQHREKIIDMVIYRAYDYRVIVAPDNQLKHYTHQRNVIPTLDMRARFDQLLTMLAINFPEEASGDGIRVHIDQISPEAWLFCHPNGNRIKSFDHGFDQVLDKLGLLYRDGKKRSLTSIRHTYASERIESKAADLKSIADNMGTTVDMLNRHYAQEIRELRSADLQVS